MRSKKEPIEQAVQRRQEWKESLLLLLDAGDFEGVLHGLARNVGDMGDLKSLVDNFCENADPM